MTIRDTITKEKLAEQEQIKRDVEAFLKQCGKIEKIAPEPERGHSRPAAVWGVFLGS